MSTQVVTPEAWTLDDLVGLPEDGHRYEVMEGQLVVSPPPAPLHQVVLKGLERLIDDRVAPGQMAIAGAGLRVPPRTEARETFVIPDLMVVRAVVPDLYYEPDDVTLVVEVVSPGSVRRDRWYKRGLYAETGIGSYLLVEPVERRLTLASGAPGPEPGAYAAVEVVTGAERLSAGPLLAGTSFDSLLPGATSTTARG